jgi:hypothetical protein
MMKQKKSLSPRRELLAYLLIVILIVCAIAVMLVLTTPTIGNIGVGYATGLSPS